MYTVIFEHNKIKFQYLKVYLFLISLYILYKKTKTDFQLQLKTKVFW